MKKNQYNTSGTPMRPPGKESISLTEAPGVYDTNPDPGVSEYRHSTGPNTIPVKFKEAQPTSKAPTNLVMGANGQESGEKAKVPTTSKMNKSKNTYSSASTNKGRLGHY